MAIILGDYVSPTEAAALLHLTRQRVHKLMQKGRFTLFEVAGVKVLLRAEVERLAALRRQVR